MSASYIFLFFFFNDTATTEIYTLSYTTLFRSREGDDERVGGPLFPVAGRSILPGPGESPEGKGPRSEEHTSELQSRLHLVCRLLLEKKKKKNHNVVVQSLYYTTPTVISAYVVL